MDSLFTLLIDILILNQYMLQWSTSLIVYIFHLLLKGQGRLYCCEMYTKAVVVALVIIHVSVSGGGWAGWNDV